MVKIEDHIIHFFLNQGCVIISTVDKRGCPNSACKGIVDIDPEGHVYVFDLYRGQTWENLKADPMISMTAIDEHRFIGYCLKGRARIVSQDEISPHLIKAWEDRVTSRLTQRLLKNLRGEKGHPLHPEALLPKPKYMIAFDVDEVVDLAPHPTSR